MTTLPTHDPSAPWLERMKYRDAVAVRAEAYHRERVAAAGELEELDGPLGAGTTFVGLTVAVDAVFLAELLATYHDRLEAEAAVHRAGEP